MSNIKVGSLVSFKLKGNYVPIQGTVTEVKPFSVIVEYTVSELDDEGDELNWDLVTTEIHNSDLLSW